MTDKKKIEDVKFPFKTVGNLVDGGYSEHYKHNTVTDSELSNKAQELYKCPKCDGINLFKSILKEHLECEDCDRVVSMEEAKQTSVS